MILHVRLECLLTRRRIVGSVDAIDFRPPSITVAKCYVLLRSVSFANLKFCNVLAAFLLTRLSLVGTSRTYPFKRIPHPTAGVGFVIRALSRIPLVQRLGLAHRLRSQQKGGFALLIILQPLRGSILRLPPHLPRTGTDSAQQRDTRPAVAFLANPLGRLRNGIAQ